MLPMLDGMYQYPAMRIVRGSLVLAGILVGANASAQPKPTVPAIVGATQAVKVAPTTGFVDDAIGGDDQRLAYVVSDAAAKCELHVARLDGSTPEVVVDLSPVTTHPIALQLRGDRAFVIGLDENGNQLGALVSLIALGKKPAGTVTYKLGPATQVTALQVDGGAWRVAVYRATKGAIGTRHQVELDDIETGKRVTSGNALELDGQQTDKALDFHVNSWAAGMTRAIGIKGGEWDKKENQRSPDTEATYDLISNRFLERKPIGDLFEQRKRYGVLAARNELDFVRMSWDNTDVELWHGGKPSAVTLDQALAQYEPRSLQGVVLADGTAWLALAVDPVNPAAVEHKKADPAYFDVFRVDHDGKATRRARVLVTGSGFRFGALRDRFWLLERSPSSERGGKSLAVYQPQ
jgi:hypothetical protein